MHVAQQTVDTTVAVSVRVVLTARDMRRVFTDGDHLIQLPCTGATADVQSAPVERSAIFLTELAAMPDGLSRRFQTAQAAQDFADVVSTQLQAVSARLRQGSEGDTPDTAPVRDQG